MKRLNLLGFHTFLKQEIISALLSAKNVLSYKGLIIFSVQRRQHVHNDGHLYFEQGTVGNFNKSLP